MVEVKGGFFEEGRMKRFIYIMASLFVLLIFTRVNAHADSATITPEDRGAIIDLIAHYGHTFDRRDGEGMANLFTDDGEWLAFPGPAFLEVIIDPDAGVYPMVGPGLAYDQMITGDFIPSRSPTPGSGTPGSNSMF